MQKTKKTGKRIICKDEIDGISEYEPNSPTDKDQKERDYETQTKRKKQKKKAEKTKIKVKKSITKSIKM